MTLHVGQLAMPVVESADAPIVGGRVLRVYRDDTMRTTGASAVRVVLVSAEEAATLGTLGNTPIPIAVVTDGRPVVGGSVLRVHVVNE